MIKHTDFLPTNTEVPRELFFPANWKGKRAWTNGHIMTTLRPDGVDKDYPDIEALNEWYSRGKRVIKAYKEPIDGDKLNHEKIIKLTCSHSEFKEYRMNHWLILKHNKPCVAVSADYYSMIIGMYGFDIELYYSGDNKSPVSVYKKDELVALIMPLRQDKY